MSVSTLIMTLNEEANLPACLKSLGWCDDIVVLDSFSTDSTLEIAEAAGARVYQRAWDSELGQRMYGADDLREILAIAAEPSRTEVLFQRATEHVHGPLDPPQQPLPDLDHPFRASRPNAVERALHSRGVRTGQLAG